LTSTFSLDSSKHKQWLSEKARVPGLCPILSRRFNEFAGYMGTAKPLTNEEKEMCCVLVALQF
jgi:hypothetical protein